MRLPLPPSRPPPHVPGGRSKLGRASVCNSGCEGRYVSAPPSLGPRFLARYSLYCRETRSTEGARKCPGMRAPARLFVKGTWPRAGKTETGEKQKNGPHSHHVDTSVLESFLLFLLERSGGPRVESRGKKDAGGLECQHDSTRLLRDEKMQDNAISIYVHVPQSVSSPRKLRPADRALWPVTRDPVSGWSFPFGIICLPCCHLLLCSPNTPPVRNVCASTLHVEVFICNHTTACL